jgi:hypothetical protein
MAATDQAETVGDQGRAAAGIEYAKKSDRRAYVGRKPSFTREQFVMLGQRASPRSPGRPV